MKRRSQEGVALVVTLILLSVITFLAVAFLAITRRDREGVINRAHQNDAVFAADAAIERVKAQLVSDMLTRTNGFDFQLFVSTNLYNTNGFDANLPGFSSITNVNYDVRNDGGKLTLNDRLQNLANLLINPRPPVWVSTNGNRLSNEFRFYIDANRNGMFDTNGWITPNFGGIIDKNSTRTQIFAVGDPEWIGILDKPEQRHSRSNFFIARYAFFAMPIGNTLDMNYIHNAARTIDGAQKFETFSRNQGVGTWEINLAAFLLELDTNTWGGIQYNYDPITPVQTTGYGFQDAASILEYRYGNNFTGMRSFAQMHGNPAATVYGLDFIDGYSIGPWMTKTMYPTNVIDPDPDLNRLTKSWSGSENANWFFSPQDFFKIGAGNINSFSNRLYQAGQPSTTTDTTNHYAFYKLLGQLGVDSAPESGKLNLNYIDRDGFAATNFQSWTPVHFFTNTANLLLSTLTNDPGAGYTNLSAGYIPIYPTNNYTPAVHRMFQLAANMYDATTSREFRPGSSGYPYFPSVFRPIFGITNGNQIYIRGYQETGTQLNLYNDKPLDMSNSNELASIISRVNANDTRLNIYGVPYIVGAKKGFPNFNEFSMALVTQLTRKVQLSKKTPSDPVANYTFSTKYVLGISNLFAVEMWNSYTNLPNRGYPRAIDIYATNEMTMVLTNDAGVMASTNVAIGRVVSLGPNQWPPSPLTFDPTAMRSSFSIPLLTNFTFVPESVVRFSPPGLTTNLDTAFEDNVGTNNMNWGLGVTNRLRVMAVDRLTGRLIDYVQLDGLDEHRELIKDLQAIQRIGGGTSSYAQDVWNTKMVSKAPVRTVGMENQIQISLGRGGDADWQKLMILPGGFNKTFEIQKFQNWYGGTSTNLIAQVPFTPTAEMYTYRTWQANDPFVHTFTSDLVDLDRATNRPQMITPPATPISLTNGLPNILAVNERFSPWRGNPNKASENDKHPEDPAFKDPLITRTDDYDFPTNKLASVGWLGRVHRGTPWQTVYLKSAMIVDLATNDWSRWTGNAVRNIAGRFDAPYTHPTNDWKIFDLFTAAPNETASRGQLSVNQTNSPSWFAVLSGAIAITNRTSDQDLDVVPPAIPDYGPVVIDPVQHYDAITNIITGINNVRASNYVGRVFQHAGDILAAPELTLSSPFINTNGVQLSKGISDAVYERIPQQILSLLKVGEARYVIYAYGQSLKPADKSIITSGPYTGICTNYAITGEAAIKAIIRVEDPPRPGYPLTKPRIVVEQYNVLPPE